MKELQRRFPAAIQPGSSNGGRASPLAELQAKLWQREIEYNQERPHLALKRKTPAERLCELRITCGPGVRRTD